MMMSPEVIIDDIISNKSTWLWRWKRRRKSEIGAARCWDKNKLLK